MITKIHFITMGAETLERDLVDHDIPTGADMLSFALGYCIAASTHTPPAPLVLTTIKPHRNEGASAAFLRELGARLMGAADVLDNIYFNKQTSESRITSAPVDCDPALFLSAVEASGMVPDAPATPFDRYIRRTRGNG